MKYITIKLTERQLNDLTDACTFAHSQIKDVEIPYAEKKTYVNAKKEFKKQLIRLDNLFDILMMTRNNFK